MAQSSATDSSSKLQKLSNGEPHFNSTIDKISSLPDSLLCHILSFLPTKHAVATSILSKRWKNLWTSVLTLDFNDEFDAPDYDGEELLNPVWRDGIGMGSMSFAFIVYRVLVLRNNASCIKRFRLRCCRNCDPLHYNAWVCAAIARDVEELDLCKSFQPVELPQSLFFTCKKLKVLELIGEFFLNVPSSVHFPSLKFMRLLCVKYQNDDSIRKLLSGCPVLEDFSIIGFRDDSSQIFNVSAPSLKKLTIRWIAHYPEKTPRKLEINAPALDYLILDDFAEAFSIENLSSLAGARVHVRKVWEHDEYYGKCAFELLRGLYNVKLLSLTDYTLETLKFASSYDLPMFHNLTRLEIGSDWHLLSNFLESAPNLEVLFLDKEDFQDDGHSCWRQPQRVPKCLSSHFGRIYIRKFKGLKDELKLVRYILKNTKVLKTMRIYASVLNSKRKLRLLKKLSMFPRGSETCQLAFS